MLSLLVASGLMLLFLFFIHSAMEGNASFGGVLLIGPIPIVFGSSPQMAIASVLLAIILMALSFLFFIWPKRTSVGPDAYEEKMNKEVPGEERNAQIKGGAVVMIGPIPLVVGSDPKTAILMMLIALAIMSIWALATLR
jgi:uncharacterized protein (TIGR00304 family)